MAIKRMRGPGGRCLPGCDCGRHNRVRTFDPKAYQAEYRVRPGNRQKARDRTSQWRRENSEKVLQRNRQTGIVGTPGWRMRLWSKYRMTPEQWSRRLDEQQCLCYLCGEPLSPEYQRSLCVDHDHSCCRGDRSCGTCVRGFACPDCNKGIGYFGDDPDRMRRVADNLEMANRHVRETRERQPMLFDRDVPTTRRSDGAERPGE